MITPLTTQNLAKLCRICLCEGELNLWEHKVKIPATTSCSSAEDNALAPNDAQAKEEEEEEVMVHHLLQTLDKTKDTVLDFGMQLLCQKCLHELLDCYVYYIKLQKANEQVTNLYKRALEIENVTANASANSNEIQAFNQEIEYLEDEFIVNANADIDPYNTVEETEEAQEKCLSSKRKICKNPKFFLTGGVTKMLTHVNTDNEEEHVQYALLEPGTDCLSNCSGTIQQHNNSKNSPQKRQRLQQREEHDRYHLENASIIVGQFIPSLVSSIDIGTSSKDCTASAMEHTATADMAADQQTQTTTELRTMDYTALEIRGIDNIKQIVDEAFETTSASITDKSGGDTSSIYMCKYCPQAFTASHYLVLHIRNSHACKFCTQTFAKSPDLFDHIKRDHQQHKCTICSKELTSNSNLRAHIKRMHGITLPAQVALHHPQPAVSITEDVMISTSVQNEMPPLETEQNDSTNIIFELSENKSLMQDTTSTTGADEFILKLESIPEQF